MFLLFELSLFCVALGANAVFGFQNLTSEAEFVNKLMEQTTRYTVHSDMRNNTAYLYLDLYQLLDVIEKGESICQFVNQECNAELKPGLPLFKSRLKGPLFPVMYI